MATLGTMATYGIVDENKIIKEFDEWAAATQRSVRDTKLKLVTCRYARFEPDKNMSRKEAESKLNELYHSDPFVGIERKLVLRVNHSYGRFFASIYDVDDLEKLEDAQTRYVKRRFTIQINNKNDFHQVIMFVLNCITNDPRTFR